MVFFFPITKRSNTTGKNFIFATENSRGWTRRSSAGHANKFLDFCLKWKCRLDSDEELIFTLPGSSSLSRQLLKLGAEVVTFLLIFQVAVCCVQFMFWTLLLCKSCWGVGVPAPRSVLTHFMPCVTRPFPKRSFRKPGHSWYSVFSWEFEFLVLTQRTVLWVWTLELRI